MCLYLVFILSAEILLKKLNDYIAIVNKIKEGFFEKLVCRSFTEGIFSHEILFI